MKTLDELKAVYELPLLELIFRAAAVHRAHHAIDDIQRCALLSIKTGGCPEDCGYCAQSARYRTGVEATPLMTVEEVRQRAAQAKPIVDLLACWSAVSCHAAWRWRCSPARRPARWGPA